MIRAGQRGRHSDGAAPRSGALVTEAAALWAAARLLVWPEQYMLASLPLAALPAAARLLSSARGGFGAVVAERDEVTLTMERSHWQSSALRRRARGEAGPFRAITIDLDLGFEVCGFLAPAAERLAGAGVSIVPQCGYRKDHLLVLESQLERALQTLQALMRASRKQARAAGIRIADP